MFHYENIIIIILLYILQKLIIGNTKGFIRGKALATEDALNDKANADHEHSAVDITSGVLGTARLPTIPVNKGGTGRTTLTSGYFIKGNGTSNVTMSSPATVKSDLGITTLETEVDNLKTSVSEGKALVAEAVTDQGVQTASDATFQEIADNIGKIQSITAIGTEATASFVSNTSRFQKVFAGEKLICKQKDCPTYMHSTDLSGFAPSTSDRCAVEEAIQIDDTKAIIFYITEDEFDGNRDSVQIQCAIVEYDESETHKIAAISRHNIISADFGYANPSIDGFCVVHNNPNDVLIVLVLQREIVFVHYDGTTVSSSSRKNNTGSVMRSGGLQISPLDDTKVLISYCVLDMSSYYMNHLVASYNNGTVTTTNTTETYIDSSIDGWGIPIPTTTSTAFLFPCTVGSALKKFRLTLNSSTNPTTLSVSTYSGTLQFIGNHDIYYRTKSGSTTHIYECYFNTNNSGYGYLANTGITFVHATSSGIVTTETLSWTDVCGFNSPSIDIVNAIKTDVDGEYFVTLCSADARHVSSSSSSIDGQFIYYWQIKVNILNNTAEIVKYPQLIITGVATGLHNMLVFSDFIEFTLEMSDLTRSISTLDAKQYTIEDFYPTESRPVSVPIFNAVALEDGEYPNTVKVAVLN